jgi:hypothetical protein
MYACSSLHAILECTGRHYLPGITICQAAPQKNDLQAQTRKTPRALSRLVTHMHARTHTHARTHARTRTHAHARTRTHAHAHTHARAHISATVGESLQAMLVTGPVTPWGMWVDSPEKPPAIWRMWEEVRWMHSAISSRAGAVTGLRGGRRRR